MQAHMASCTTSFHGASVRPESPRLAQKALSAKLEVRLARKLGKADRNIKLKLGSLIDDLEWLATY